MGEGQGKGQGEGEGPPCCIRYARLMRQLRAPASCSSGSGLSFVPRERQRISYGQDAGQEAGKGTKTKTRRGGMGKRGKSKKGTGEDQVEGTEADEEAVEEIVTLHKIKRAGFFGDPEGKRV